MKRVYKELDYISMSPEELEQIFTIAIEENRAIVFDDEKETIFIEVCRINPRSLFELSKIERGGISI